MTHRILRGRRRLALLLASALVSVGLTAGSASAATNTFSESTAITIPDSGTATPYPSSINVSGFAGNVQNVTVTLRGFSHTCPDDVSALLVGPSGRKSLLMSDVGGCGTAIGPIDVTFDQTSENGLNSDDDLTSGTFAPSIDGAPDPLDPPAPAPPYGANLGAFSVGPANGTWQLFIQDQGAADQGMVGQGWSLKVTAPVNTVTMGTPSLNKKNGTAQVPVTVGDAGQLTMAGQGVATVASAGVKKSVAVSGPGTTFLTVRATGKKKKKLNTKGKVNVSPTITFTPTGGTPHSTPLTVKLKKKLKK